MRKKLITSAAIAATLVGTMAPAILASAAEQKTKVTFENQTGTIVADYTIVTKSAIEFTAGEAAVATVEAPVMMAEIELDENDEFVPYSGAGTADISVASANGFEMEHLSSSVTDTVPYTLTYEGTELASDTTVQEIGSMSSEKNELDGKARLGDHKGRHMGIYTDQLTYTITDTTEDPAETK